MKTRYNNIATITTIVGGNLVESTRHLSTTRKPLTYRGAKQMLGKTVNCFVDLIRLESMAVSVR